jgi:calcineurin-like phosphoesterase family protein
MRRLITSDLQLCDGARDQYRTDFFVKALPALLEKYQVDELLILGDLTEGKDRHPAPLVNMIVTAFHELQKICKVIVLEGNHDFLHKEHPYFKFVERFPNLTWISVPTVLDNCLYLPHTRDYKKDWKNLDFDGHDFIFAHNIFEGVKANGESLAGIPRSIFPDGAFCISGDVHEPQTLGPVTYVGSPCLCDFGDSYQPRVLLLDDLKVKSIKVHGQQKRLVYCAVNKIAGKRELAFDHDANAGDLVKIKVEMLTEDVSEWATIRTEVENWAAKNSLVVNTIIPIVAYVEGERQRLVNSSKKSDSEYLKALVHRQGIDERTAQVGKEIVELI